MIRKAITILSLIGLLLSVGLWILSFRNWHYRGAGSYLKIMNSYGGLGLHWGHNTYEQAFWQDMDWNWSPIWITPKVVLKPVLSWRERDGFLDFYVYVPLWIPALGSGVVLYFCHPLYHHRRRKRKKLGLCLKCGYNLTGLTDLRCPECGEAFEESCSARP